MVNTVILELPDGRVRQNIECLCCDCRQRIMVCTEMNKDKDKTIQKMIDLKIGMELIYFANAFIVDDKSRENIEFFKLESMIKQENHTMINMRAKCCGSFLCGAHPYYMGKSIYVVPMATRIQWEPSDYAHMDSVMYIFAVDFPESNLKLLPKKIPVCSPKDFANGFADLSEIDRKRILSGNEWGESR